MQRTQLIIFFYYVENRILFYFYWSLLKYLYDKIQIKFDLYFFVNDTNDRSFIHAISVSNPFCPKITYM